jgi:Putative bacterial sensory transduction regulator
VTISVDQLKSLAKAEGLGFFVDPNRPAILLNFSGHDGSYQVVMLVELDGRFIQFRTIGYAKCPSDHPNLAAVLRVLGEMDYRLRLTKFGWDPADGEVVGYVDLWLEDATLTQKQFGAMLRALLPAIDMGRARITKTMETGVDPDGTTGRGGGAGTPVVSAPPNPIVV